jgi:hypothetical protein
MNTISLFLRVERRQLLHYIALLVITVNCIISFLSITLFSSASEILSLYPTLFNPSGCSISTLVVHALLIGYSLLQIAISKTYKPGFSQFALLLASTSLFELAWQYSFSHGKTALGMLFLFGTLLSSCFLFIRAQRQLEHSELNNWWKVPICLYFTWLSITSISVTSSWVVSLGWERYFNESICASVLILFIGFLGVIMAFEKQDSLFPLITSWYIISIGVKQQPAYSTISITALGTGLLLIWCALISMIQSSKVMSKSIDTP